MPEVVRQRADAKSGTGYSSGLRMKDAKNQAGSVVDRRLGETRNSSALTVAAQSEEKSPSEDEEEDHKC